MSNLANKKRMTMPGIGISIFASLTLIMSAATGCTGDDGEQGATGPEGLPGTSGILDPSLPTADKAFIGAGGQALIDTVTHFSYKSSGSMLVVGEGLSAFDSAAEVSTFDVSVSYDIGNDNLRLDYDREILFIAGGPFETSYTYSEIINGNAGVVNGDDDIFPGDPDPDVVDMLAVRWGTVRKQQRLLNPHLLLKEISADPTIATEAGITLQEGTIHERLEIADSVFPITLFVNSQTGRVTKLATKENDYLHRDAELEIHFADYQNHAGLLIPHKIIITRAGEILQTQVRSEFLVNPTFEEDLFDFPAGSTPAPVDAAEAALGALSHQFHSMFAGLGIPQDSIQLNVIHTEIGGAGSGVFHLTGGSHHSMLIKQENGVVIVEAPLYPERAKEIIAKSEELFPGVPITHVIATHHHEDHSAGLREFVAAGATVILGENSEFFFRDIFRAPSTVAPDTLAMADPAPGISIQAVEQGGIEVLADANNEIDIVHVDTGHADDMLMVRVGSINAVFNSDMWNPNGAVMGFTTDIRAARDFHDAIVDNFGATVTLLVGGHGATGDFSNLANFIAP